MGISIIDQQLLFVYSLSFGAFLSAVYCLFRIVRNVFSSIPVTTFILDFLYFIFTAIATVIFVFAVNNGEIRIYVLASVCLGWIIFFFTLGRLISLVVKKCSEISGKKCRKGLK